MKRMLLMALLVLLVVFVMAAPALAYTLGDPTPCDPGGAVSDGHSPYAAARGGSQNGSVVNGENCLDR
jgi:hypothetical protein